MIYQRYLNLQGFNKVPISVADTTQKILIAIVFPGTYFISFIENTCHHFQDFLRSLLKE